MLRPEVVTISQYSKRCIFWEGVGSLYDFPLEYSVCNDYGASFRIFMPEMHGLVVVVFGVIDAAHHSLVVAEEEYGEPGEGIDEVEKAVGVVVVG